ncbi:MAG: acylneuraminate cytidylyltransferase family protein [Phycisphaerae bacterium]|nr:acylneuraminate cytidylyltransferase family protein [Phycisphaerae bacterium]
MNVLGVIMARAGSAGLKNKHLLPLLGQPVIDYTFDHCREATRLTRIVLSSDCPTIRARAEQKWFETIIRPAELSHGEASVQDVMLHALKTVESRSVFRADALVVLYGNVPVRPAGAIDSAIELLESSGCDSVRSFTPVGKYHPQWMSKLVGDRVEALHSGSIHRRQDLTPLFLHDGAVVAVSRESMLRGVEHPNDPHAFFGDDRRGVRFDMGTTVEIDHQRDLFWAEAVLRERGQRPTGIRRAS